MKGISRLGGLQAAPRYENLAFNLGCYLVADLYRIGTLWQETGRHRGSSCPGRCGGFLIVSDSGLLDSVQKKPSEFVETQAEFAGQKSPSALCASMASSISSNRPSTVALLIV
jgi:hypothetical protein